MKKYQFLAILTTAICLFSFSEAFARITVVSVKGTAAFSEGRKWSPLQPNMELKEGTKVSTGVKSTVVLKLNNNTLTIRPLSMLKIYENSMNKGVNNTKIALRRGSVRAQVAKGERVKTVFKIATPVATSSVRGTIEDATTSLYGTTFGAPQGNFDVDPNNGQTSNISGDLTYDQEGNDAESGSLVPDSTTQVYDPNISSDERDGMQYFGSDSAEGGDSTVDTFDNLPGNARVTIGIQFP